MTPLQVTELSVKFTGVEEVCPPPSAPRRRSHFASGFVFKCGVWLAGEREGHVPRIHCASDDRGRAFLRSAQVEIRIDAARKFATHHKVHHESIGCQGVVLQDVSCVAYGV